MASRWKKGKPPKVFLLRPGLFLYEFETVEAKQEVLERNWTFRDHPLLLKQWAPDLDLEQMEVTKLPLSGFSFLVCISVCGTQLHLGRWRVILVGHLLRIN